MFSTNITMPDANIDAARLTSAKFNGTVEVGAKVNDPELGEAYLVSIQFASEEDHNAWLMERLNAYYQRTAGTGVRPDWKKRRA